MQLIPHSYGLWESNDCHNPEGPGGGQFCSDRDAFVPAPRQTPKQRLLEVYPPNVRARIEQGWRTIVGRTASDGNEHLVVAQPGKELFFHTSGAESYVEMPHENFIDEMRDSPPEFTAHTHPTSSAPSALDLRVQVRSLTSRQIIFAPNGEDWYELHVTDFAQAAAALSEGRRYATYWETATKGKFQTDFDRLKKQVQKAAFDLTDAMVAKKTGWETGPQGFKTPQGWQPRGKAVKIAEESGFLKPREANEFMKDRFAERSPKIWLKLVEKYDWVEFRYHQRKAVR